MLLDNIRRLCKQQGISISTLEKAIHIGNGTISRWSESSPRIDNICAVAKFFGVTIDELLEGKDRKSPA